ncbi:MAG: hypothetical protein ACM3U1_05995 [Chloroflexota bacterium]
MIKYNIKVSGNTEIYIACYESIIHEFNLSNITDKEDIEIILTSDFDSEINEINKEWNLEEEYTKEKEYSAYAKTISNLGNNKHKILLNLISLLDKQILVFQILTIRRSYFLPPSLVDSKYFNISHLEDLYNYLIMESICTFFKWKCMESKGFKNVQDKENRITLEEFQRKIKIIHNKYQEDANISNFRDNIVRQLISFIYLCLKDYYYGTKFSLYGNFKEPVLNIIKFLENLYLHINLNNSYSNFDKIEFINSINKILNICFIEFTQVPDEINKGIYVNILKNPKYLFKDDLLDTQNCFVAFVDILGFTNYINDYDNDPMSNILKTLSNALEESIETSIQNFERIFTPESLKTWGFQSDALTDVKGLLQYRMFSDCFTFALPFFNNDKDYIIQLTLLTYILRLFQYKMLVNGFLIRGGLSYGSFYADKNMLFSGGLVRAYNLEKFASKVGVPRIIIDNDIIRDIKIKLETTPILMEILGLKISFVKDDSLDPNYFINPFGLEKSHEINIKDFVLQIKDIYELYFSDRSDQNYLIGPLTKVFSSSIFNDFSQPLESPFKNFFDKSVDTNKRVLDTLQDNIQKFSIELLQVKTDDLNKREVLEKILLKYQWTIDLYSWEYLNEIHNFKYFNLENDYGT